MELGIITFIAPDNSHGYLFRLSKLDPKYIYDIIKTNNKDNSVYVNIKNDGLKLQKYQVVIFNEKTDNKDRKFARIKSTEFRSIVL